MSRGSPFLVMPRDPDRWGGAAALWVTVAGWAGALRRLGMSPKIITPSGELSEEACLAATSAIKSPTVTSPLAHLPPQWARQLVRDAQNVARMRRVNSTPLGCHPRNDHVPFFWRHHELFHSRGTREARSCSAPMIEYLHAPVVWEARRWGVNRHVTGSLLERWGEAPRLRDADLVACVSLEVAEQALRLGVPPERVRVAPMGVDPERFHPGVPSMANAERFRPLGQFVFGWTGSFRAFHAVEHAVVALHELRESGCAAGLVLVGDGPDRSTVEDLARRLGVSEWTGFLGQRSNAEIPSILAALDATVLTVSGGQAFHYSPLKLREYLAMGRAVVAPRVGEMARYLEDGTNAVLYDPAEPGALSRSLAALAVDGQRCDEIGAEGRKLVLSTATWDVVVQETLRGLSL